MKPVIFLSPNYFILGFIISLYTNFVQTWENSSLKTLLLQFCSFNNSFLSFTGQTSWKHSNFGKYYFKQFLIKFFYGTSSEYPISFSRHYSK